MKHRGRQATSGMTLLEITISITVLVVGVLGFSRAIISSLRNGTTSREVSLATEAARRTIETLQATPFDEVFARFNGTGADDPGGPGTAPGRNVQVLGLQAQAGDGDGVVGEIVFPTTTPTSATLRENLALPALATPRDLNGDGVIDGADHSGDYDLLPVVVRMAWRGTAGPARMELRTLLVNLR